MDAVPIKHALRLDHQGYTHLPEDIFQGAELQLLDASNNALEVLDQRLGMLTELQQLDLSYNQLQTLPNSFAQLHQLERLILRHNKFTSVPAVLCQLPNLRVLDLGHNQLMTLPADMVQLQALVELNLTFNKLTHFSVALCQLPRLEILRLKSNQLQVLPEEIGALKALRVLDLEFNPLKTLPDSLAQLHQLEQLNCLANEFATFPNVLLELPQILPLDELDLGFRLGLRQKQLTQVAKLLQQLAPRKVTTATKKALFRLLCEQPIAELPRAAIFPLLALRHRELQKKIAKYLLQKTPTLRLTSRLFRLGKFSFLTEEVVAAAPWVDDYAVATHIVLGERIAQKELPVLHETAVFISERAVQQHYQPLKTLAWLEENKGQLLNLLRSHQGENILLALQWLEGSTLLATLATELLLAYVFLSPQERAASKALKRALRTALPNFEPQQLPHVTFKLYAPNRSESETSKRIATCIQPNAHWDGLAVARYLFVTYQVGYGYLIQHLPTEELNNWLKTFTKGTTLDLSCLTQLQQLPPLPENWIEIKCLNLRGCAFSQAPQLELLQQLPSLEEIDLRNNPIRYLPRTLLKELSSYRVLLSK